MGAVNQTWEVNRWEGRQTPLGKNGGRGLTKQTSEAKLFLGGGTKLLLEPGSQGRVGGERCRGAEGA